MSLPSMSSTRRWAAATCRSTRFCSFRLRPQRRPARLPANATPSLPQMPLRKSGRLQPPPVSRLRNSRFESPRRLRIPTEWQQLNCITKWWCLGNISRPFYPSPTHNCYRSPIYRSPPTRSLKPRKTGAPFPCAMTGWKRTLRQGMGFIRRSFRGRKTARFSDIGSPPPMGRRWYGFPTGTTRR